MFQTQDQIPSYGEDGSFKPFAAQTDYEIIQNAEEKRGKGMGGKGGFETNPQQIKRMQKAYQTIQSY